MMHSRGAADVSTDSAYQELRRLIIEGIYAPGERLVEERLAEDLGVSRTPVRQALARAEADGLVQIYPHRGAVVRTFTHEYLMQTYDLRAELEGYAAHQAALHVVPAQLEVLESANAALERSLTQTFELREDEVRFLVEQNKVFHMTIVEASGNDRLRELLRLVINVPLQFRSFTWYSDEERRLSNFFHRSILHALRNRDSDRARGIMREHIYFGRDALIERLEEAEGS